MKRRKQYTTEFKRESVQYLISSGKSQNMVCQELGLPNGILGRWKKELDQNQTENGSLQDVRDKRIQELEREVQNLKQQRDILKKAMGITLSP
ncbi:transposase [Leptospira levettii]|uniref:Transposase n=3 Tax=Leptospira TaxID=171 RepID=A0ABY2N9M2_9LEPT|nr:MULTISPECIES: transposase [Leptospira]MCW7467896.1 transposase [Leptospira levettii]MCW7498585.1 transposase [Leptospira levettii]MCW7513515.1 transposase [Leptospira levettii]MCW7517278.1 transposase [Leptospira levettii]TGM19052.1 transposase [Leptospira selangorensis]